MGQKSNSQACTNCIYRKLMAGDLWYPITTEVKSLFGTDVFVGKVVMYEKNCVEVLWSDNEKTSWSRERLFSNNMSVRNSNMLCNKGTVIVYTAQDNSVRVVRGSSIPNKEQFLKAKHTVHAIYKTHISKEEKRVRAAAEKQRQSMGTATKAAQQAFDNALGRFKSSIGYECQNVPDSHFCPISQTCLGEEGKSVAVVKGNCYLEPEIRKWVLGDGVTPGHRNCPLTRAPVSAADIMRLSNNDFFAESASHRKEHNSMENKIDGNLVDLLAKHTAVLDAQAAELQGNNVHRILQLCTEGHADDARMQLEAFVGGGALHDPEATHMLLCGTGIVPGKANRFPELRPIVEAALAKEQQRCACLVDQVTSLVEQLPSAETMHHLERTQRRCRDELAQLTHAVEEKWPQQLQDQEHAMAKCNKTLQKIQTNIAATADLVLAHNDMGTNLPSETVREMYDPLHAKAKEENQKKDQCREKIREIQRILFAERAALPSARWAYKGCTDKIHQHKLTANRIQGEAARLRRTARSIASLWSLPLPFAGAEQESDSSSDSSVYEYSDSSSDEDDDCLDAQRCQMFTVTHCRELRAFVKTNECVVLSMCASDTEAAFLRVAHDIDASPTNECNICYVKFVHACTRKEETPRFMLWHKGRMVSTCDYSGSSLFACVIGEFNRAVKRDDSDADEFPAFESVFASATTCLLCGITDCTIAKPPGHSATGNNASSGAKRDH